VQKSLNAFRRSEGKTRRLEEECAELETKWENFQRGLKESFIKERAKFHDRKAKVVADINEAYKIRDEALQELQEVFSEPSGAMKTKKDKAGEADAAEAMVELEKLLSDPPEQHGDALVEMLTEAVSGGAVGSEGKRQKLLNAIKARRSQAATQRTPSRRRSTAPPMTPPSSTTAPSRTYAAAGAQKEDLPTATDPYITSPSAANIPNPAATTRSRSRNTPRIPIKLVGRGLPKPAPVDGLAKKLDERRGLDPPEVHEIEEQSDDEEDAIADLVAMREAKEANGDVE